MSYQSTCSYPVDDTTTVLIITGTIYHLKSWSYTAICFIWLNL